MLSPVTHAQFERVLARFPGATLEELPSGAALVTLPEVQISPGWSHERSTLRFIVPAGYPGPSPDCFWADATLTLAGGGPPQASQSPNLIPETIIQGRWFSWHVTDGPRNWNPNRDTLMTYVGIILDRFRQIA